MATAKIAVTIDRGLLAELDRLVTLQLVPNRSRAVQDAVRLQMNRIKRTRLARECAKLDKREERQMAEEGIGAEGDAWPAY